MRDGGSGRQLFDRPQHSENEFGTAQLPSWKEYPWLVRASGSIQVTVQNLDLVNAFNVRISFSGFKIFGYPARD